MISFLISDQLWQWEIFLLPEKKTLLDISKNKIQVENEVDLVFNRKELVLGFMEARL